MRPTIKSFALTLSLMFGVASPSQSDPGKVAAEKEAAYRVATELATCAGLYTAISSIIASSDPATAKAYNELGNGAAVAAGMVATSAIKKELAYQFADNIREVQKTRWELILRSDGVLGPESMSQLEICKELSPLQVEMVEEARKQAYGFK